jgi:O-antigen ligase
MKIRVHFGFIPLLVLVVGLGSIVVNILTPRDIEMGDTFDVIPTNPAAVIVGQSLIGVILVASVLKILFAIRQDRGFSGGTKVFLSYLLFFISNTLIPGFVGHGALAANLMYAPIVFAAVYLSRPIPTHRLLALIKTVLLTYLYGSLLSAVIAPDWALLGGYEGQGVLPSVDTRLFGVSSQAVQLGPLMAAYFVIECLAPTESWLRKIHLPASLVVLVWTQAKTAWVFVLIFVAFMGAAKLRRKFRSLPNLEWRLATPAFYSMLAIASVLIVAGVANLIPAGSDTKIETLTGRTAIWSITLDAWADNPIFGYGLGLWDVEFRTYYGMPFAGQAHNQFIHTLGSAGIIGLSGLLVYLWAMGRRAFKVSGSNPVALALFCLVVVECVTEAPLRNGIILSGLFFLQLVLFIQLQGVRTK